jgi:hypothetical protein
VNVTTTCLLTLFSNEKVSNTFHFTFIISPDALKNCLKNLQCCSLYLRRGMTHLSAGMARLIDARQFLTYSIESFTDHHFFCEKTTYKY